MKYIAPIAAIYPPLLLSCITLTAFLTSVWIYGIGIISSICFLAVAASVGDVVGRSRQYFRTIDYINAEFPGYVGRWVKMRNYNRTAWCTRTVMLAVCRQMGQGSYKLARNYYYDMGYRWYHIFPDKTFTKDSPFLKPKFWSEVFRGV